MSSQTGCGSAEVVFTECIAGLAHADAQGLVDLIARAERVLSPRAPAERERCRSKAKLLEALLGETRRNLKLFGTYADGSFGRRSAGEQPHDLGEQE